MFLALSISTFDSLINFILTASDLSCGMQDLHCIMWDLSLWCTDSSCVSWAQYLQEADFVVPQQVGILLPIRNKAPITMFRFLGPHTSIPLDKYQEL